MVGLLVGAIAIGVIFLYGCVGEILNEKSGHLNLGIPGIMCMGAVGGALGVATYVNALSSVEQIAWLWVVLSAILGGAIFGAAGGAIYAFLTVSLRSNQNVTGLALTIFGSAFAQFVFNNYVDSARFAYACKEIAKPVFGFYDKLGWFGEIFLSYGILVYLGIAIAIIAAIVLKKSRLGLNLCAIGESPATADATGINVTAYKYFAIMLGCAVAGLGGMYYLMDYIRGSWSEAFFIEEFGWLAIALVIFCLWKPDLSILGAFVFGALYKLSSYFPVLFPGAVKGTQTELLNIVPYLVTVIVLIITSILDSKENQPPASLGLNYFREER